MSNALDPNDVVGSTIRMNIAVTALSVFAIAALLVNAARIQTPITARRTDR